MNLLRQNLGANFWKKGHLRTVPTFVGAHRFCTSCKAWFKRHPHVGVDIDVRSFMLVTKKSKVSSFKYLKVQYYWRL